MKPVACVLERCQRVKWDIWFRPRVLCRREVVCVRLASHLEHTQRVLLGHFGLRGEPPCLGPTLHHLLLRMRCLRSSPPPHRIFHQTSELFLTAPQRPAGPTQDHPERQPLEPHRNHQVTAKCSASNTNNGVPRRGASRKTTNPESPHIAVP